MKMCQKIKCENNNQMETKMLIVAFSWSRNIRADVIRDNNDKSLKFAACVDHVWQLVSLEKMWWHSAWSSVCHTISPVSERF